MNVLSLFAGIGGLDLGLERAGFQVVGQVEIDPYCQRVLAKHWPEVPRHDDVRTAAAWWRSVRRPRVDVIAGGFPCQPASYAGLRRGTDDERWLWPDMADVIDDIEPEWVLGENVPGLRTRGLTDVLGDLAGLGYRARTGVVSACEMGAPHPRARLFVLAHAAGEGCQPRWADGRGAGAAHVEQSDRAQPARGSWWAREPRLDRVAYGVPAGMDRRRVLGNAVVPQVAEHVGRMLLQAAGATHE